MEANRPVVEVVAGVLLRGDEVLLASRPPGKVYAGWWEFPGGKVEAAESQAEALARELHEELGITVHASWPWLTRVFDYAHARVRIHFRRIYSFSGRLQCKEGQEVRWEQIGRWQANPMLPANAPILRALELPDCYAISAAGLLGESDFLAQLDQQLAAGLRLVQLREKAWPAADQVRLGQEVVARARAWGARVLVNADMALEPERIGADGIHLSSRALQAATSRPAYPVVAASCHTAEEIAQAAGLGLDFVAVSPVQPTLTHPAATPLGWEGFARLVTDTAIPVYALGGLIREDAATAVRYGAHGVALLREAWR